MNHQAVAGQHLNNVVIYTPYCRDGELLMFAMVRAHWVDIGGLSTGFGAGAGVADPWLEGLQLDQLKIHEAGRPNEVLLKFIRDNIRFPEAAFGDMRSQITACKLAVRRLDDLFGKFGREIVLAAIERIFDETEAKCRNAIATIPDGTYEAETLFDGPDLQPDSRLRIHAKVTVAQGAMAIDFSGCAGEQHRFGLNARTFAGARVAYKALTLPLDPVNEGSFRALDVIIPEGNIMMARYPLAMSSWGFLPTVIDTVVKALVPVIPDRLPAGHFGVLSLPVIFFGTDPATGKQFLLQGTEGGGWGGRPHEDGESGAVSVCQGDVRTGSIEGMEMKAPILIEERSLRRDSGGAGEHRGGLGVDLRVRNFLEGRWNFTGCYRMTMPPGGALGGGDGKTSEFYLRTSGDETFDFVNGSRRLVPADSEVIVRVGGGGGWGDPLRRDPERVRQDVEDDFISVDAAEALYGVILDGPDLIVDQARTDRLRADRAGQVHPGA
jgi:N-methylhydantoinase B